MKAADTTGALLLDLDEQTWKGRLDRVEAWLNNVLMAQTAFRVLAQDVRDKVNEPNVKSYLGEIARRAEEHEHEAEALFRLIGREPSATRKLGGTLVGKARQALADIQGLAGGAAGAWPDLHQLLLASQNAVGAFGVANTLGLAIGHRELTQATLSITGDKYRDHFMLQELVLELSSLAILYQRNI
jgi:hypothetical protein